MAIAFATRIKDLHAEPADVRLASHTLHVIAAFILLDRGTAFWTIACVMIFLPHSKLLRISLSISPQLLVFVARVAHVSQDVARRADCSQTRGTIENPR